MIEEIEKFAKQGLYIGIYPILQRNGWQWVGYVSQGKDVRTWLEGDEGCSLSSFKSPQNAYNAAIKYCKIRNGQI